MPNLPKRIEIPQKYKEDILQYMWDKKPDNN